MHARLFPDEILICSKGVHTAPQKGTWCFSFVETMSRRSYFNSESSQDGRSLSAGGGSSSSSLGKASKLDNRLPLLMDRLPPSDRTELTGTAAAKQMLQITQRISTAVGALYRSKDSPVALEDQDEGDDIRSESHDTMSQTGSMLEVEPVRRASLMSLGIMEEMDHESGSESGGDEVKAETKEDASDLEDYDVTAAVNRVCQLTDALRVDERAEIMASLNDFFSHRAEIVEDELEQLERSEQDQSRREAETKDSLANMIKSFDFKNMKEMKVLLKCTDTLRLGSKSEDALQEIR